MQTQTSTARKVLGQDSWRRALALLGAACLCRLTIEAGVVRAAPKELTVEDARRALSYKPPRDDPPPPNPRSDNPMFCDPALNELPSVDSFDPRLVDLWKAALQRPEVELRRKAAETIGEAYARGMPGLEVAKPRLLELLSAPELQVRLAAASSLVQFNDPAAGPALLPLARRDDAELALVIDPALAAWRTAGAADLFLARLKDNQAAPQVVISAITQLGTLQESRAVATLLEVVLEQRSDSSMRLAAARACGLIAGSRQDDTLLAAARKLLPGSDSVNHLLAATLLAHASGADVQTVLLDLCRDPEPAVVGVAAGRLLAIDPNLLSPVDEVLIESSDNTVRAIAVSALVAQHTPASTGLLLGDLGDICLPVRTSVRKGLEKFDQDPALRALIRPVVLEMLQECRWETVAEAAQAARQWRKVEEAVRFSGDVGQTEAAAACVKLMVHRRAEVRLASIIALRGLAVPETVVPLRERAAEVLRLSLLPRPRPEYLNGRRVVDKNGKVKYVPTDWSRFMPPEIMLSGDAELAQLLQTLGLLRDKASDPLMRRLIPKGTPLDLARQGAIWGLAKLHEGKEVPTLTSMLLDRMEDQSPLAPESESVQEMSGIALGIMRAAGAKGTLESLTKGGVNNRMGLAAMWALDQIEGRPFEMPPATQRKITGWFIEPLD